MDKIEPFAELPRLDIGIFKDIADLLENDRKLDEDEKKFLRKIEKYEKNIEQAQEMIHKAQQKKEELLKRNLFLKECLANKESARREALKYWDNFGIQVKQLTAETDDHEEYEFSYTKLKDSTPTTSCVVGLRFQDGKLDIFEQVPEILTSENMKELCTRINDSCIRSNSIDYRLAMLKIRKDLIKALSISKTSLHQPIGTSTHICT